MGRHVNTKWFIMNLFFVVVGWSWSRSNGGNGILSNWYNRRGRGLRKRNKSLRRGFNLRHTLIYPFPGRSLIPLLNFLGKYLSVRSVMLLT